MVKKATAQPKSKRVPVDERALIGRINRVLKKNELKLFTLKGHAAEQVGRYIVVPIPSSPAANIRTASPELATNNLEALAREYGALAAWEELAK